MAPTWAGPGLFPLVNRPITSKYKISMSQHRRKLALFCIFSGLGIFFVTTQYLEKKSKDYLPFPQKLDVRSNRITDISVLKSGLFDLINIFLQQ